MESDYVMRLIKQFVEALASIIHSRKAGRYEQALEQIQLASLKFLNTDISFFFQYSPDQLLEYFNQNTSCMDTENCIVCADLLYELAMISEEKGMDNESLQLRTMALNLYVSVIPRDTQFLEQAYIEKTNSLLKQINVRLLPKQMQDNIHQYQKFLITYGFSSHEDGLTY
jgi:hypothetical protein